MREDRKKRETEEGGEEGGRGGERHDLSRAGHFGQGINQTAGTDKDSGNQNHMLETRCTKVLICFW